MTVPAPTYLLDLPASRWRAALAEAGLPGYRGEQIANWVFERNVFEFEAMTNLPAQLRADLPVRFAVAPPTVESVFTSVDRSRRYLLGLDDGMTVEAVSMPSERRTTFCISSQVGCRFACTFCKTGELGLRRSLSAGEIVGQVLRLRYEMQRQRTRINVVFMGQGEPLDNADAVIASIEALEDERGAAMSWRRITVSTVGLVPAIERLSALGERRPRLAVSLNATTDALRSQIMPINRKYPIASLMAVLRGIPWRRREKMTFEYVLLGGVNDSDQDAKRLIGLLHGLPAKVNLIPWNPIDTMPYSRPSPEAIERFRQAARAGGLDALVRYSRGTDIGAACGQLQAAVVGPASPTQSPVTTAC